MNMKNFSSTEKGQLAELYFEVECIQRGVEAFKPTIPNKRFDYLIKTKPKYPMIKYEDISWDIVIGPLT